MAMTEIGSRFAPLAEELLENRYARENLIEGAEKLRAAYERSQKRRVKPSRDRKVRAQFEAAIAALDEGSAALLSGRRKPRRKGRKLALGLLAAGAAALAVAYATNEELRGSLAGSARALGEEIATPNGAGA